MENDSPRTGRLFTQWTGLEWTAIHAFLQKDKSRVMLCRFDRATVKGLFDTAGFLDLDSLTPDQAADYVLERLARNEGFPKDHYTRRSTGWSGGAPKGQNVSPDLGAFRLAWLFPATVGAVSSAVLMSLVSDSPSAVRQVLIALALITPLFAGVANWRSTVTPFRSLRRGGRF